MWGLPVAPKERGEVWMIVGGRMLEREWLGRVDLMMKAGRRSAEAGVVRS